MRLLLPLLLCGLLAISSGSIIPGFTTCPPLSTKLSRDPRTLSLRASLKLDDKWNFPRFVKTFTTFNGLPFLGPLGKAGTVQRPDPKADAKGEILWSFGSLSPEDFDKMWAPLDDVVMGGLSMSRISLSDGGNAKLDGITSSGNNGGFCSARTRNVEPAFDVSSFKGISMRAKSATNMRYKLILRDTNDWDAVAWCHSFDMPAQKWVDIRVSFRDFIPVVRGKIVSTRDINTASIYSVQIMLSKYEYDGRLNPNFKEGPFELEFGSIGAYR